MIIGMKKGKQIEAQALRRSGKSIRAIAALLEVSQGTVSRWCADITLLPSQRLALDEGRRAAGLKALAPWIARNKLAKLNDTAKQQCNGTDDVGNIVTRDLFMLGLGLYWGEGYKRGNGECGFTNSDPAIIRTILKWFRECYDVDMQRVIARVTINNLYQAEAERIMLDWSNETNIPLHQFGSPSFISGYGSATRDARTYRGTLRIKIRNGTSLKRRILASLTQVSTVT